MTPSVTFSISRQIAAVEITEDSSSIGKALTLRILQEGATLIGSRHHETLATVSDNDDYLTLAIDVADRQHMLTICHQKPHSCVASNRQPRDV